MAFKQYPDNIATSIYLDDEMQLSDITYTSKTQLRYLGLQIFKYGLNSNVKLYIKAYTTSDVLITTSEAIKIDQFPNETDYFYGWVYFKFDKRVNLSSTAVRFKLYLENYTFSEASWIGAVYDWPTKMGYNDYTDQINESPFTLDVIGAS